MIISFDGYHGTSYSNAESIVRKGFQLSYGYKEWLGDGVYFFVEGLSPNPIEQAEKWAVAQAWDNQSRSFKYKKYSILKSRINVDEDNLLDLTTADGVELLNYLSERFVKRIKETGRELKYFDGLLINLARQEGVLPIEVAKGNFYIKFAYERQNRIDLRTANCTISAVYNPNKNLTGLSLQSTKDI